MTLIYWTFGWLAGIWLASLWQPPAVPLVMISLALVLAAVFLRHFSTLSLLLMTRALAGLGAMRYSLANQALDQAHIAHYNGRKDVTLEGLVIREPQVTDYSFTAYLEADRLRLDGGQEIETSGTILLRLPRYSEVPYGARLEVTGDLEIPQNFNDFDYRHYLAQRGILSTMKTDDLQVIATNQGNPLLHVLLRIKERAQITINHLLPEPQAALLSGILLGNEAGLPDELLQDFQDTGMTHIIAISGFNIAIIAGILLVVGRHLIGVRRATWIALAGIAIYTIFVGAQASVVRAAAMGALIIIATRIMGRPIFIPTTIFSAALLMTLINPMLLWDIGFQLSFAATLGLALYLGPWSKRLEAGLKPYLPPDVSRRATRLIADVFLATMAATIMTLPISVYHFGRLSLISPLTNLLILPAQPGIMLWGGLTVILGTIIPAAGQIPAWIAWLFLSYTIGLVRFFANFPLSNIPSWLSFSGALLTYSFVLGITWLGSQERELRGRVLGHTRYGRIVRVILALIVIGVVLFVVWIRVRPDGNLHVVFFDVGQGDATFIQTPQGQQVLVDGGKFSRTLLEQLGGEMPFWDKEIDILIVTHPDNDHYLGLIDTLEHYRFRTLIHNGQEVSGSDYKLLLEKAAAKQIPIHRALAGEVIEMDNGVRLEILHPDSELDGDEDNDNSIAMRLVFEDFTFLLTGDVEAGAERKMLAAGRPLQAVIYKAGHHGANTSSSALFLEAVRPQYVIISAGEQNNFGHPHQEMLDRAAVIGASVMRTDQQGTLEVISDGKSLRWK